MKLYEVYFNNGLDNEDESHFTRLMVAKDEDDIKKLANERLRNHYDEEWYKDAYVEIDEVTEVDGFTISVTQ